MKRKKYSEEEKLLQEIARGERIRLQEDRLQRMAAKCLHELGFVRRDTSGLSITERGELAKEMGIRHFLNLEKTEEELMNYSAEKAKRMTYMLILSFVILLLLLFALIETNPDLFLQAR